MLDNIHDPHNASAILRSADSFGVGFVTLLYTHQEPPEISKGVSGYSHKWMTVEPFAEAAACVAALRGRGLRIISTHIDPSARSHTEIDWTQHCAIVLGNEHTGCSKEMLALSDERVFIPMQGMAQSFNVSVSAGILLAELWRQRDAAGMYAPQWSGGKEALFRAWVARDDERYRR